MILVTAANGRTGRALVDALSRAGHPVRAFDIAAEPAELRSIGAADVVTGDMLDGAARLRALEGVRTVVHVGPPMHHREAEMGRAMVGAAREAHVAHFVQFSVTHPQLEPLLNHQAKLAVERAVLTARMPFTILQPMHYMQNTDVARAAHERVLRVPYPVDTPLAHVDLQDVAEVAASVVGDPRRHHYATYELCGEDLLSTRQLSELIAAACGHTVSAEHVPFPTGEGAGASSTEAEDHRMDAMVRLFDHYGRYGITGNPNVLAWLLGRAPTSFAQYVHRSLKAP
jgi:uncharacterized protein YbjT (DUF2867 family)